MSVAGDSVDNTGRLAPGTRQGLGTGEGKLK